MVTMLWEYVQDSYLTLVIVTALVVMMISNRKVQIKEESLVLISIVAALTVVLSIGEFLEKWCNLHDRSYHILYVKSAIIYTGYPLIALLILYLAEKKHRVLLAIPQVLTTLIALLDLSERTALIYGYRSDHSYYGGPLYWVPFFVEGTYIVILAVTSMKALQGGKMAFGMIVAYMAFSCLISIAMVRNGYVSPRIIPGVVALEVLVYYYYLTAIRHREVQEALDAEKLKVERSRSNLLMSQIRPHFINSNLAVIRSLCYEDSEKAVEMIDHFSAYLRENIKQINDRTLVSFEKEMESVDNYLYLEMQRFQDRIQVKKELTVTDFEVPPLAIQTIVENAVRHGISMTGKKGTVTIGTEKRDGNIIITVKDDGMGFDVNSVDFDGATHVGIKNVTDRFQNLLSGSVSVESAIGEGTTVTIRFPERKKDDGEGQG